LVLVLCGACFTRAGYTTCAELLAFNDFYDSTVNNAELKATYENVIKTMDNQVVCTA
jgi:hypothetical protein